LPTLLRRIFQGATESTSKVACPPRTPPPPSRQQTENEAEDDRIPSEGGLPDECAIRDAVGLPLVDGGGCLSSAGLPLSAALAGFTLTETKNESTPNLARLPSIRRERNVLRIAARHHKLDSVRSRGASESAHDGFAPRRASGQAFAARRGSILSSPLRARVSVFPFLDLLWLIGRCSPPPTTKKPVVPAPGACAPRSQEPPIPPLFGRPV
jgi:hypothetical protein